MADPLITDAELVTFCRKQAVRELAQYDDDGSSRAEKFAALADRLQELASIRALCARRPALDEPTLLANVTKAIQCAAKQDEAERHNALLRQHAESHARDYASLAKKLDDAERRIERLAEEAKRWQTAAEYHAGLAERKHERAEGLAQELRAVDAFLATIEWTDHTSETSAADLRVAIADVLTPPPETPAHG